MFGNQPYDRFGNAYNVSRVLTSEDKFDLAAYEEYSPLYLPAAFAITYLVAFALSTNVIVHTILYHGRTLLNGFKRIRLEEDDIHYKLMQNYPEVPEWWYGSVFVIFFGLAIVAAEVRRHMANGINAELHEPGLENGYAYLGTPNLRDAAHYLCAPVGLYLCDDWSSCAQTPSSRCALYPSDIYPQISLNLLAQIIPGTLLPGQPLANMFFKAYSVQTLTESTSFVQDLKLGHYIKVPPRATFLG
jgi:hypothetical protein